MRKMTSLMTPKIFAFALVFASLASSPAGAHDVDCASEGRPGGEWRQFGNQVEGDRTQSDEFFIGATRAARLHPAWTFDANRGSLTTNNEITGYPIVADGCVYVGSSTGFQTAGWLFALNADSGELVWRKRLDRGVYSTVAVAHGAVYAFVSKVKLQGDAQIGGPYVVAVDQFSGQEIWRTTVDYQIGSDAVSSPIVYDGMVWVGVSATAAEVTEGDRGTFQGSFVLLDALTGEIIRKTYTIPEAQWEDGFAGAAQWGTIAIDAATGFGYEGTGNPFNYDFEHERTNAVIKIDLARARDPEGKPVPSTVITNPRFAEIVGVYKGDVEEYYPDLTGVIPCGEVEDISGAFALGIECARLDLDFGAQPNIFTLPDGRSVVGIGQKSGVYHVFDASTMQPVWKSVVGVPSPVGGIVGSAAYDGETIYGPHTIGGYIFSLDAADGALNWASPTADGVHWGPPVVFANHVLYTVDLKGFLDAYDADTGAPLLHMPMFVGADTHADPTFSWGGTTVARNTVYASVGVGLSSTELPNSSLPNGFVIAYRPLV
jgi:polyvinyl alcohol dehydrogenase (cytochrome)